VWTILACRSNPFRERHGSSGEKFRYTLRSIQKNDRTVKYQLTQTAAESAAQTANSGGWNSALIVF
jgi:hypothetical protein